LDEPGRVTNKSYLKKGTKMTTQTFSNGSFQESQFVRQQPAISKTRLWTGRGITGLAGAFLLLDGVMKLVKPVQVMEATQRLGFPVSSLTGIGIVLITSTLLYLVPRTSAFGALLLTGYLGGAVATQVRAGSPAFEMLFPVIFGVLVLAGLLLRDNRLRVLLPIPGR
jgi:hypothetical protein